MWNLSNRSFHSPVKSLSTFTDHLRLSHYLNISTRHTPATYFVPKALPRRLGAQLGRNVGLVLITNESRMTFELIYAFRVEVSIFHILHLDDWLIFSLSDQDTFLRLPVDLTVKLVHCCQTTSILMVGFRVIVVTVIHVDVRHEEIVWSNTWMDRHTFICNEL